MITLIILAVLLIVAYGLFEHFATVTPVTPVTPTPPAKQLSFIVNGRSFLAPVGVTTITYYDVVNYTGRPSAGVYTVTWKSGAQQGSLTAGQSVTIINGMVFNAVVIGLPMSSQ